MKSTVTILMSGLVLSAGTMRAQEPGTREIGRTTEKEVNVVLSSTFGSVTVSRGAEEKVLVAESYDEKDAQRMDLSYAVRNRVGYLDLALGEANHSVGHKTSLNVSTLRGGKWDLRLSDALPVSLDIELGVGNGDFDLTGLQVKDFNLSTGASDVSLTFDKPNQSSIDNMHIETGVSKFYGRNLGNANFNHFRFEGGVGAYTLDFTGNLNHEADVDIEVGLGALTIIVPQNIGARVLFEESWVSRLDTDRDFKPSGHDQFDTDNYNSAAGKMNIRIDSGLGSVKIRRK
jgi:N-terminal domain of toast_rack, DUF2154